MYLSHHYAVDLIGGGLLAAVTFYYVKSRFLPRVQADKFTRWDYDYIEIGSAEMNMPGSYDYDIADGLQMDSDEWTVGSSSSISSGSLSPVDEQSAWGGEADGIPKRSSDLETGLGISR